MKFVSLLAAATCLNALTAGAQIHPVETEMRRIAPATALESTATFKPADTFVGGKPASGLRPRFAALAAGKPADAAEPMLEIVYPRSFDGLLVVESRQQRVVLRAVGGTSAPAIESDGKLVYSGVFRSMDAVEVPHPDRSEEFLLFRDERAPRVVDFEIVEMTGVASVSLRDGAVFFHPALESKGSFRGLQIDAPVILRSTAGGAAARWSLPGDALNPKTIRLTVTADDAAFPLIVDPSFSATGELGVRLSHTATLLPNGKVLIAGGNDGTAMLQSARLYDPASGTFLPAGNMTVPRGFHTATLLADGRVLLAGGVSVLYGTEIGSAEIYDPATNTFTATGSMKIARAVHTATRLPDGKVLLAGGMVSQVGTKTAEIYDPSTGTFSSTGSMAAGRDRHTATLLPDGNVLIAGGFTYDQNGQGMIYKSAEVYVPSSGTFSATADMTVIRYNHSATLLPDGRVLIAGGYSDLMAGTQKTELYDPTKRTFTAAADLLAWGRVSPGATLMPDGTVLLTGGDSDTSAEIWDPSGVSSRLVSPLAAKHRDHTATLLPDGRVLIAGGTKTQPTAEFFDPTTAAPAFAGSLGVARDAHTATLLADGRVFIAGGETNYTGTANSEIFDAAKKSFAAAPDLSSPRSRHTATLLANGNVLITGGVPGINATPWATAEIFNPVKGTIVPTASMAAARSSHTATLLPDGKVLIAGGYSGSGQLRSAEIFDPAAGKFSATGSMAGARNGHTATLLPDGKVLIAGGYTATGATASAELFDPATGAFTATGSLASPRAYQTATLLPNGMVLIAGGYNGAALGSTEIYDPSSGTFGAGPSLITRRYYHSATLLNDGSVVIAGGVNSDSTADVELFVPELGSFTALTPLGSARASHAATLLTDGSLLLTGGYSNGTLSSAELYAFTIPVADARRPAVSAPSVIASTSTLTLTGSGFRGDSEGSCGAYNSSPANFPFVTLQSVGSEQRFVLRATTRLNDDANWSSNLASLPVGLYQLTLSVNAVPSTSRLLLVTNGLATISSVSPSRGPSAGGQSVTIAGTNLSGVSITIGGNSATVTGTTATTATFTTPAHPDGVVDIIVTTADGGSTVASRAYTYGISSPTNVVAAASGATIVNITWTAVAGATSYEVRRSSNHTSYAVVGTSNTTSFSDTTALANTAYLYTVRTSAPLVSADSAADLATTVVFTDPGLTGVPMKAAHINELRTAVNAVRRLAALDGVDFTDVIVPGVTPMRAIHIGELRTALSEARAAMALAPMVWSHASVSAGVSIIYAADLTEIREGTK